MPDRHRDRRRRWLLRIGWVGSVVFILAAAAFVVGTFVTRGRSRFQTIRRLEELGAFVKFTNVDPRTPRSSFSLFLHDRLDMEIEPIKTIVTGPITKEADQFLLAEFEEVEGIQCPNTDLSDEAFRRLTGLTNLRLLFLGGRPLGPASFPRVRRLNRLEFLWVAAVVNKEGWDALSELPQLRTLGLTNCRIVAQPPLWLFSDQCPIQHLCISGDHADNAAILKALAGMPSVRTLNVYRTRLDDDTVNSINAFANLEKLTAVGADVPAEFSPDKLTPINLKNLSLHDCKIHPEALERCSSWTGMPTIEMSGGTSESKGGTQRTTEK